MVDLNAEKRSIGETLAQGSCEPPINVAGPSGYPAAQAVGAEWSVPSSSIALSDSDDDQHPGTVHWHDNAIALSSGTCVHLGSK